MSFQTFVTERLAAITALINAISTNAKKIDELPVQETLSTSSKFHVSKGGISESLEISKLIDAISSGTFDQILSVGEITVTGNVVAIPSDAQASIGGVVYVTVSETNIVIPYTSTDLSRIDILVFTTDNEIVLIQGIETAGLAIRPNVPLNTVLVTQINVTDASIGTPAEPIIGTTYKTKLENSKSNFSLGSFEYVSSNEKAYYSILNQTTGFLKAVSINGANNFMYNGKEFVFDNLTGSPLVFKHLDTTLIGSQYRRFYFSNSEDFVLQDKEKIVFRFYNNRFEFFISTFSTNLINDLTTGGVTKALTAEMGKFLQNNKTEKGGYLGTAKDLKDKQDAEVADRIAALVEANARIDALRSDVTTELLEYQKINNQIYVSASTPVLDSWHGKLVTFTANLTVTVPATGLRVGFNFEGITDPSVTVNTAITTPKAWYGGYIGAAIPENSIFTFVQRSNESNKITIYGL